MFMQTWVFSLRREVLWISLKFALRDFKLRKFASALTVIAIMSGLAAFTALRIASVSMEVTAKYMVKRALAGEVIVYGDGLLDLSELALPDFEKIPGVKRVVPLIITLGYMRGSMVLVVGAKASDLQFVVENYVAGGGFNASDEGVAVVDQAIAKDKNIRVDDIVLLKPQAAKAAYPLRVVGVAYISLEIQGMGSAAPYVIVPLREAQRMMEKEGYVTLAMLVLEKGVDPEHVVEMVRGEYPNAKIFKREDILKVVTKVVSLIDTLLLAVTFIGLAVAIMGTANTIMSNVREHSREIAILRALGAKGSHVALIFILESLFYGVIGGVLGVSLGVLGAFSSKDLIREMGMPTFRLQIEWGTLLVSFAVAVLVSVGSSIYPSIRASRISPVRVMKNE